MDQFLFIDCYQYARIFTQYIFNCGQRDFVRSLPGILISWAGECAGAALGFFTMRYLFQDSAKAVLAKGGYEEKIADFSSHNGFGLMLAGRALPFVPSGVLTAAGALSSVTFRDFIFATCIGKVLSVAIEVLAGIEMMDFNQHLVP